MNLKDLIAKATKGPLSAEVVAGHLAPATSDGMSLLTIVADHEIDFAAFYDAHDAQLMVTLWNRREAIAELIEAAKAEDMPHISKALEALEGLK